uniref:Uncharacterized protein n=1 Tax=Oryza sativa subsp. japonica TaxID=39947 RepID=Q6ZI26_ORYSJ|nr:hypothetical protein [Oryza sativa Japonica Group]
MARLLSTRLPRRCLLACGRCAVRVTEVTARPEGMVTVDAVGRTEEKEEKRRNERMGKKRKEGPTCQLV